MDSPRTLTLPPHLVSRMPRKLVCVLGSEFYNNHARLLATQMVRKRSEQLVCVVQAEVPLSGEPVARKPTGINFMGRIRRKPTEAQASAPPPYTKAVSDAYGFLSEHYRPDDEIVLFVVTGVPEDWNLLRSASKVLAEHLEAGTVPPRVAPDPNPVEDAERDTFGDRPKEETPNNLLGKRVESSVAIVYRSVHPVSETNNFLLEEFPLSVKRVFSLNWSTDRENYCNTIRDDKGQVISREVCYFKHMQWHIPSVTNSTMNFIRYLPEHTRHWKNLKPSPTRTLASLPTHLIPECPPMIDSPPPTPPPRSRFTVRFGRKSGSTSSTASSVRASQRTETLMSGFTTTRRSDTLMSGASDTTGSFAPLVSSPARMASYSSSTSPDPSPSSLDSASASDRAHSSMTSVDPSFPTLRESYNSLPGMTKHQVWTYPAFGTSTHNYGLPARVVWMSSRE